MYNSIVLLFCLGIKYQCLILLFSDLVECIYNAINKTMQSTKQPDNTNAFLFIDVLFHKTTNNQIPTTENRFLFIDILFLNITTKSQNHIIKH